ncbi:MAG: hypothetical protein Kow0042_18800 [Calditrichia bacterium]
MTYIVLARRYRPMIFEEVLGQEHVTRTLMNALKNNRIAHGYIFAGPRGVGKTSTARLLAKAVNCEKQPAINPCNECPNCRSITSGQSMDVLEIDGASNRGIDEIRNLRENIRFAPANLRYKIYIIDEVHMLTKEAFNALLKTLEEPPPHAIFIFATTEIHRVPLTILSRCQRFDFKKIGVEVINEQLNRIVKEENIDISPEALLLISRKADGSMRDAESIMDQLISFSDGKITIEEVRRSLGLIDQEVYFEFTQLMLEKNVAGVLRYAQKISSSGHDLMDFLHGLQEHFRNLLLVAALKDTQLLEVADYFQKKYQEIATQFAEDDLIHYIQIVADAEQEIKFSPFPQLSLETLLLKLTNKPKNIHLEEILAFLQSLKKGKGSDTTKHSSTPNSASAPVVEAPVSPKSPTTEKKDLSLGFDSTPPKENFFGNSVKEEFAGLQQTLSGIRSLKEKEKKKEVKPSSKKKVDLDEIKRIWPTLIESISSTKVALGSFLQEGVPHALEGNNLVIAYDRKAEFNREHVENNRSFIENLLREQFDISVKLKFKTIDFKEAGIEVQPRTPEEILEDIKNKEPIIKKIINLFDLEDLNSSNYR